MRAADTNVLVRLFTQDDTSQADAVEKFIDDCARRHEPIFVAVPVLCELVWVLSGYGVDKLHIADVVESLLTRQIFRIDREHLVGLAVDRYRSGKGDFADYLIGAIAADAGCRDTVSFDRALKGAPEFTIL